VGAGAAGALNMWYDADIDARMARTQNRPVPAGRVAPREALAFGITLAGFAIVVLGLLVNVVAGALLAATIAFYVLIYTMWLKRRTPQNIVIGGAAGALPPMIGWASVTGGFAVEPVLLFLIIFFWTPPHFWALSLYRAQDYARAGIPMLPVVSGEAETRRQILLYSLILAPLGASPWLLGYAGPLYGIVAVAGGAAIVALAVRIHRNRAQANEKAAAAGGAPRQTHAASKQMFAFSILYLFLLFAMLLVDRLAGPLFGQVGA
jgi:heme o synthase